MYRHYATLYFVFIVDEQESELGILDLVQGACSRPAPWPGVPRTGTPPPTSCPVFVETLDRYFENVCELDLIFHSDKTHFILDEIVMGGMVLETSNVEILTALAEMDRLEKDTKAAAIKA